MAAQCLQINREGPKIETPDGPIMSEHLGLRYLSLNGDEFRFKISLRHKVCSD